MARRGNDELLDEASSVMGDVLRRMRERMQSWDIERAAFGVEDPAVVDAQRKEDEKPEPPGPENPPSRGRESWREVFKRNWPDGAPRKRRRRWWV